MNSRLEQSEEKEYLKLFVFAVNPDNVWGARLRRLKGLSLAEVGTFGKSAKPYTILTITLSFICSLLAVRVGNLGYCTT